MAGDSSCRWLTCEAKIFRELRRRDPRVVLAQAAWPRTIRAAGKDGSRRAKQVARVEVWSLPPFPFSSSADMAATFRTVLISSLVDVSKSIANAHAAIHAFAPKLVVVGNDLTMEGRAACRVAATRGVHSAVFMHSMVAGERLHGLHCADRLLVYGAIQHDQLVQMGCSPQRIVVCGAPNLDDRPPQAGEPHPLLQKRLGFRPGARWILVATSGPGHSISSRHHEIVIENIARLSIAMPEVPIVVKLHPKDRVKYYEQCRRRCQHTKLLVLPDRSTGLPESIFDWLQGSAAVLTGASSIALEAMLMQVPVITMDFHDEIRDVDFIDAGATIHVRSADALVQAVREVLFSPETGSDVASRARIFLERAFCALDGNAASRGAKALQDLMNRPTGEQPVHVRGNSWTDSQAEG